MRVILLLFLFWANNGFAAITPHNFADEQDRQRYQQLIDELRCPKCQNQNLAGSDAAIAADLRNEVYRLINEGATDNEIREYMVARYGEFVLYRPRLTAKTLALWVLPTGIVLLGLSVWWAMSRQRRQGQNELSALSLEDQSRLQQLLAERGRDHE